MRHLRLSLLVDNVISGLSFQLLVILQGTMISVYWTGANLANLIKAITFLELTSKNVLVLTNLAICINLALIAMVSEICATAGCRLLVISRMKMCCKKTE